MRISEFAKKAGCHLETVRYYERIGLLPEPRRSASGYRHYSDVDAERLHFIVRSRALGFHLDEIRSLLTLASESSLPCRDVDALAREHLAQVEAKQRELTRLADELRCMIDACHNNTRETCSILSTLSSHANPSVVSQQ
ncbi:MAG TPA: heavy metal-responsive transcriptional regulator [Rhodanobacteraceae bacterium]|nr:heavy metal-responsive transcriptional regulator [Rhodanobacteraceae bacterium]